jgi:hypothetical protein|tara:strand:- start:10 stop:201 length:192 start_codon:yes stop_codon:yes gene_type:complete
MAHLIELTTAGQSQKILFNLDTMVSAERGPQDEYTSINTRWGYQNVKETLEYIMTKANDNDNN